MNNSQENAQAYDDGLVIPEIGAWGEKKYELVSCYAKIFLNAMKGKWECLVYIDLFSGAGYSKIRGTSRIVLASPLRVLDIPEKFNRYIFCEKDYDKISALNKRVDRYYYTADVKYILGDSNLMVPQIISEIPSPRKEYRVLCFCFADPYKMQNLEFLTIEQLVCRYMDFLLLIPTGMDATRNVSNYIKQKNKTVDKFLGTSEWRKEWEKQRNHDKNDFGSFITNQYGNMMEKLGYIYPGIQKTMLIRSVEKNLPLYRLSFFSKHPIAQEFWQQAKKYSNKQLDIFN